MHICPITITTILIITPVRVHGTFREQSVAVKGIVNCRGIRQPGTFVQLYDEDLIPIMDSDDLLGSATADELGVFCVRGYTTEISVIEPYIYIEHNCGYEGLDQKAFFVRAIPPEFIMEGNYSRKTFHMGDIDLLTKDAPIQHYQRRAHVHYHHHRHHYSKTTLHEQIVQCIPHYVAYRDYYERVVVSGGTAYNETKAEQQTWDELFKESTGPPHVLGSDKTSKFKAETHTEDRTEVHRSHSDTSESYTSGYEGAEEQERTVDERKRQEWIIQEMERKKEEERLREVKDRKKMDEEQRIEDARLREEQLRQEEEKRRDDEARLIGQQLKEDEEVRRIEEERRRIQQERMEIEKQRLKEEEELRREEQNRYAEEHRKEEERRREEGRLREEERRKEEEQRRAEERRRDEEHRKEMEARRKEHLRRLDEFRHLEEQRRLEMIEFQEERRQWKEKMKEEEKILRKKIETMCSRDANIRTSEAREKYSNGVDPCEHFKKT